MVNLTNGGMSGGYRKYLTSVVPRMSADPRIERLDVFVSSKVEQELNIRGSLIQSWPAMHPTLTHLWLVEKIRQLEPSVVFIPTLRWIDCGQIPIVTMMHNMAPFVSPLGGNTIKVGLKNLLKARLIRRACKRSNRVIAVSNYVADFLVKQIDADAQKVGVVYHGVDSPPPATATVRPTTLQSSMAGQQFLFTAGSIRPFRGLDDVIRGLGLARRRGINYELVIAGQTKPATEFYKEKMNRLAAEYDVDLHVHWAGQLSAAEMSWCYFHCAAFVMTSRAEACPNTLLGAMSHGCLSISTDCPPMPELFRDSAIYYKGRDAASLAEQLVALTALEKSKRQGVRRIAQQYASKFDWNLTVDATIAQLEMAHMRASVGEFHRVGMHPHEHNIHQEGT